jgi:protein-S-isoprenylcysteine O-methyltransferase Ste14
MLLMGIVMLARARDLLAKRLDAKEKQAAQKGVQSLAGLVFMAGFVLAGLDFRFGWSDMPLPVVIAASVIFLIGYGLYAEVMRENAYLSRTVKVEEGQTVISTGLYGIVRHPMYLASVLMFLSIPLVMGSWYALIPFAFYPVLMVVRILDEEKLLSAELSGYDEYKKKVKYRMIPFIW